MKLLTLAGMAAVAAACNGISPTSPGATVSSDDATALVDAQALAGTDQASGCRDITHVQLHLLRTRQEDRVEAVYLKAGRPAGCTMQPVWSSNPRGRLIPTRDPFVVRIRRTTPPSPVTVTARAPNGVKGSIRVPQG